MSSQSDLVGGEQNGQTSQPLVANQNHQSPGTDQKCRARKRVNNQKVKSKADGKKKAKSPGKDQRYRARKRQEIEKMERQLEKARKENDDLKEEVTQHTAWINTLQQLVLAGTINQFGPTMGPLPQSHLVERAHWNNVEQPGLTYGGLTYNGDLNYTSLLGAAMASGSSLMQGSLAPVGQGNNSEQSTPYNADQSRGVN